MDILEALLSTAADGEVLDVRLGLHWTAVLARVRGEQRCGLAATMGAGEAHASLPHGEPDVPAAGRLTTFRARQLAEWILPSAEVAGRPRLISIGMAALNALLPQPPEAELAACEGLNASDLIMRLGREKRVVLVGHFPFVTELRAHVEKLSVLELNPQPGDLPAEKAAEVVPEAEIVAITSMTLINRTLAGLLALCSRDALVMLLGPSTPLSPQLFDYGIHLLSGSVVVDPPQVLHLVSEGGTFRQIHRAGVRLVNLVHPSYKEQVCLN